jgi:hypothetical protein
MSLVLSLPCCGVLPTRMATPPAPAEIRCGLPTPTQDPLGLGHGHGSRTGPTDTDTDSDSTGRGYRHRSDTGIGTDCGAAPAAPEWTLGKVETDDPAVKPTCTEVPPVTWEITEEWSYDLRTSS